MTLRRNVQALSTIFQVTSEEEVRTWRIHTNHRSCSGSCVSNLFGDVACAQDEASRFNTSPFASAVRVTNSAGAIVGEFPAVRLTQDSHRLVRRPTLIVGDHREAHRSQQPRDLPGLAIARREMGRVYPASRNLVTE